MFSFCFHLFTCSFFFSLGVDWGGLRREWVELLCKALFSHESGFFTRFNADDPQALVGVRLLSSGYIDVCQLAERMTGSQACRTLA